MSCGILFLLSLLAPDRAEDLIRDIVQSGAIVDAGETAKKVEDPRKQIAPGAPPLLSFRYFQGADRGRFGNLDLMLDDAGH